MATKDKIESITKRVEGKINLIMGQNEYSNGCLLCVTPHHMNRFR